MLKKGQERLLRWLDEIADEEKKRAELEGWIAQRKSLLKERMTLTQAMPYEELVEALVASERHPGIRGNAKANRRYYTHQKLVNLVMLLDADAVELAVREQELRRVERRLAQLTARLYPPGISRKERLEEIGLALQERAQRQVLATQETQELASVQAS